MQEPDGKIIIATEIDNSGFDKDTKDLKTKMKEMADKLSSGLGKGLQAGLQVGKKLGQVFLNIVGSVVKLGFRLFGIASIVTLLVGFAKALADAFKKAFKDNDSAVGNIKYLLFAVGEAIKKIVDIVAQALMPKAEGVVGVLQKIINLIFRIMQYVAYLINAWTGVNIFENATVDNYAKAMEDAEKSSAQTAKNAKEIKKQLAGFDEMNILSDNSGGGDTGGGGVAMPTFDLSNLEGLEELKWLNVIKDIGQWVLDNWQDVVLTLLLIKLFIDILTGNWLGIIIDLVLILIGLFFKAKDAIQVIAENWKESFTIVAEFMKNKVIKPIGDFFSELWQKIKDGVKSAVDWVKDKFGSIIDFFSYIISSIIGFFRNIGTKVGDAIGGAFKTVINGVLGAIENILNFPIKQVNKLLDVINKVPGINISKLSTFSLPRLAKGGIVNYPGKGVPVGGAIAGESGAEWVQPLTDSQSLDRVADAIGKRIVINATITNTMNGRVISKELQKIQAEENFAYNR